MYQLAGCTVLISTHHDGCWVTDSQLSASIVGQDSPQSSDGATAAAPSASSLATVCTYQTLKIKSTGAIMVPSYFFGSSENFRGNAALACTSRGEGNRTTQCLNHAAG